MKIIVIENCDRHLDNYKSDYGEIFRYESDILPKKNEEIISDYVLYQVESIEHVIDQVPFKEDEIRVSKVMAKHKEIFNVIVIAVKGLEPPKTTIVTPEEILKNPDLLR